MCTNFKGLSDEQKRDWVEAWGKMLDALVGQSNEFKDIIRRELDKENGVVQRVKTSS